VHLAVVRSPARTATEALVLVDGRGPLRPAVSQFGAGTEPVGTPAIDSSVEDDVYLTVDALPTGARGPVTIGVTVQPLVLWLWGGGALVVLGAVLAAVPGRRRRPTDPTSAPVPGTEARPAQRAPVPAAIAPGGAPGSGERAPHEEPAADAEESEEPVPATTP